MDTARPWNQPKIKTRTQKKKTTNLFQWVNKAPLNTIFTFAWSQNITRVSSKMYLQREIQEPIINLQK